MSRPRTEERDPNLELPIEIRLPNGIDAANAGSATDSGLWMQTRARTIPIGANSRRIRGDTRSPSDRAPGLAPGRAGSSRVLALRLFSGPRAHPDRTVGGGTIGGRWARRARRAAHRAAHARVVSRSAAFPRRRPRARGPPDVRPVDDPPGRSRRTDSARQAATWIRRGGGRIPPATAEAGGHRRGADSPGVGGTRSDPTSLRRYRRTGRGPSAPADARRGGPGDVVRRRADPSQHRARSEPAQTGTWRARRRRAGMRARGSLAAGLPASRGRARPSGATGHPRRGGREDDRPRRVLRLPGMA